MIENIVGEDTGQLTQNTLLIILWREFSQCVSKYLICMHTLRLINFNTRDLLLRKTI